jgi:DNA-binding NtrC family response regulator
VFDVVIADWKMPGGSGVDVLVRAKLKSPTAMLVLWTGRSELEVVRADPRCRAFRILPKTTDPSTIEFMVKQGIAMARVKQSTAQLGRRP